VRILRAELLKAGTTRLLLWYVLGLVAFVAFALSTRIASDSRDSLQTLATQRSIMETTGLAAVIAVLLGAILVTTEYAHGTITQSLLAIPVRERLLAGKLAAAVLLALAFALLSIALTLVVSELWYAGRGLTLHLDGGTSAPFLGALAAAALAAAIGTGLGALLRRQTATVVVILLWLLIGEAVLGALGHAARYSPGRVLAAIVAAHRQGTGSVLGLWPALAVAFLYALALCAAGALASVRSDVSTGGA
jgi:ABC-2 type transport system permease protein